MPVAQRHDEGSGRKRKKRLKADGRRVWLFKIAAELGRTVDELAATITNAEFIEWMAYFAHIAEIENGTPPPAIVEIDDVETRSALIDKSFFGDRIR